MPINRQKIKNTIIKSVIALLGTKRSVLKLNDLLTRISQLKRTFGPRIFVEFDFSIYIENYLVSDNFGVTEISPFFYNLLFYFYLSCHVQGGYQAYFVGNINFEIEVAQQGPYMYQHFGEVSATSAPNRLRATPREGPN